MMPCDICGIEESSFTRSLLGSKSFNACARCAAITNWANEQCHTAGLEIVMERGIRDQVEQVCTTFASFDKIRRLSRQEFRALLRERLQEFGDKCMTVWDEKCGGKP